MTTTTTRPEGLAPRALISWVDPGGVSRSGEVRALDDEGIMVKWDGGALQRIPWNADQLAVTTPAPAEIEPNGHTSRPRRRPAGNPVAPLPTADGSASVEMRMVSLSAICPSPLNPRHRFDTGSLDELVASIRVQGILEPLLLRPVPAGVFFIDAGKLNKTEGWFIADRRRMTKDREYQGTWMPFFESRAEAQANVPEYEILAGERRWRAASLADLAEAPCVIRAGVTDAEALEIMLVENDQRADISDIERAEGLQALVGLGYTQAQLAEKLSRSQGYVSRLLGLLALPEPVRTQVDAGVLSRSHAERLERWKTYPQLQQAIARLAEEKGASVRDLEAKLPFGDELLKGGKLIRSLGRWDAEFDRTECQTCPHRVEKAVSYGQNDVCLHPPCWLEKRAAAKAEAAEQEAKRGQAGKPAWPEGVVDLSKRKYDSYEYLYENDYCPSCTEACECRALGSSTGGEKPLAICLQPAHRRELKVADANRWNEEADSWYQAAIAALVAQPPTLSLRTLVYLISHASRRDEVEHLWNEAAERLGLPVPDDYAALMALEPDQATPLLVLAHALAEHADHVRWPRHRATLPWFLDIPGPGGTAAVALSDEDEADDEEIDVPTCSRCHDDLDPGFLDLLNQHLERAIGPVPVRTNDGYLVTCKGGVYCPECAPEVMCCQVCGCTDEHDCEGGCSWVEDGLCSNCAPEGDVESE